MKQEKTLKIKNSYFLSLLLVTIICIGGNMVKAQQPVNIKEAIDIALANNYGLRADSLDITATAFKNKQLLGAYLPQVNYSSAMNYNMAIPSQMLPGAIAGQPGKDYVPVQFGTKYNVNAGIEVTQNIYRKDLLLKIRSSDLNTAIFQTKYRLTREEIVYQVAAAFYDLQSSAEKIRTTASDYNNLNDVLTIAKAQYENGTLKRIEYESLEINVANKQSQLDQLKTKYSAQLNYFKYLLGIPAEASLSIDDSIHALTALAIPDENESPEREDIHLYRQLIASKEIEMKTIKAEGKPAISTYFRYNRQAQFSDAGKMFNNDYWSDGSTVGISTSISIFDGNRRKNRIHVAQTELQQLQWQKEYQQQKAQTEVLNARETFRNNEEQYHVNLKNLALAEKVFASRRALYTEGVTTLMELLDAERELTQARDLYIQSLINIQTGLLDVHKANGTLLTKFINAL